MRVCVIGSNGMLGTDVVQALERRGHGVTAFTRKDLDIREDVDVYACTDLFEHDFVVNCAAYTAVDRAEEEPFQAELVNSYGPLALAAMLYPTQTRLVHISTDFVFPGTKEGLYNEDDATKPINQYGKSKLEGEQFVTSNNPNSIILRTAWLYGPNGSSFPKTMIRAWEAGKGLRVVADQFGTPTYTKDLAKTIVEVLEADLAPGIYHAAGSEVMTWHTLAELAINSWKMPEDPREVNIEKIKTSDWPTPAIRPVNSSLDSSKLARHNISPMRSQAEAMREFAFRLRNSQDGI